MRQNPTRRTALLDAAIDVLAGEGSRGLTFRAVDTRAGAPNGTASNYFASREDLLHQVADRTTQRLAPAETELADTMRAPRSTDLVTLLLRQLLDRMRADRASYLAMLELRLEATRRPEIQAVLTEKLGANLRDTIRWHLDAGLPGDETTVLLLYLAMAGLLIDHHTIPGVLAPVPLDDLIAGIVTRTLPQETYAGYGPGLSG